MSSSFVQKIKNSLLVDPPNSALSMEGDGSNSAGRQLRPRKSVLTDISNKLSLGVSQITDATKKAVVGKKRKLSTVISKRGLDIYVAWN